jgi:GntR family transcriptional regulator, transcriptional repressor for pyruvate dehydrogenase complex
LKRADWVAGQIKQLITDRSLRPGDRLPKEHELQALFGVSKGTMREALALLEADGLVRIRTGPRGGATIGEVPFDRAFRLLQNYLYFREPTVEDLYAVRLLVEPELAAGAVPALKAHDFAALEATIDCCAPDPLHARQQDLHFHDILANAHPNPLLRFLAHFINRALRDLIVIEGNVTTYQRFGESNVAAHRAILDAARRRQNDKVRTLMRRHIEEALEHVRKLRATVDPRLIIESELSAEKLPAALRRR